MRSAALALRQAIHAALLSHPGLAALLGGPKIYDEPPRCMECPFITLGDVRIDDWSTATSRGHEHLLALNIYSRHGGRKEAQILSAEVMQILESTSLVPPGHVLVNLRFATADIRRDSDEKTYRATVRFRAVTEVLP